MIYLIRHGQTEYNQKKMFQGRKDIPLNELGQIQADSVALKLKDLKIDYLFSSPLTRAKQTAEAINKFHNNEIIIDERLVETDVGQMQGKIATPESCEHFFSNPHKYGAEAIEDVYVRVADFFKSIEDLRGKNIVIVAHAGTNMVVNFITKKRNIKKDKIEPLETINCGVYEYEF